MKENKLIKISGFDFSFAVEAFRSNNDFADTYINTEAGKLVLWSLDDENELDEFELEDPKYYYIEPLGSTEAYKIMEKFIHEQVKIEHIREKLFNAISQRKPFRRFKDALYDFPEIQNQYYDYEESELERLFLEQLECDGYTVELIKECEQTIPFVQK